MTLFAICQRLTRAWGDISNTRSTCFSLVQLATLVTLQQEHLDLIETNVQQTKNLTEKGAADIKDAHTYQQKSKKV